MPSPDSDASSDRRRAYRPRGAKDATLAARIAKTEVNTKKRRRKSKSGSDVKSIQKRTRVTQRSSENNVGATQQGIDEEEELLRMTSDCVVTEFKSANSAQHTQFIIEQVHKTANINDEGV
jgi:hypothetical protein